MSNNNNNNNHEELSFSPERLLEKGKRKSRFESLKPGSVVYRILPSLNPLNKDFSHTWNTHFLQIPGGTGFSALCTLYSAEKYCPLCERAKELDLLSARAKENGDKDKLSKLAEEKRNVGRNRKVYYNAVNNGTEDVVVLQLSKTASDEVENKIYKAYGDLKMDALSLKTGLWFKFTRVGSGLDTKVDVEYVKKSSNENGEIVERYDRTPLTPTSVAQIEQGLTDVHNPAALGMKTLSAKELGAYLRGETITLPGRPGSGGSSAPQTSMAPTIATVTRVTMAPAEVQSQPAQVAPQSSDSNTNLADEIARMTLIMNGNGKSKG
jgi:hypothetical protein